MANANYADYSIGDFDKNNCLNISKGFYLILAFILRGYVIWIMSVTNMKDHVSTLAWVYPDKSLFYLSLASGAFGLLLLLIVTLRRPQALPWVRKGWFLSRHLLIFALILDLAINFGAYYFWQLQSTLWLIIHSAVVAVAILFCFVNKRFKINLTEFPEDLQRPLKAQ